MARYSSTFSGDISSSIAGMLFQAASMGKVEHARAMRGAETNRLDKDTLGLRRGEFTAQALKYMMTPKFLRRGSFGNKYPDYFAKGQSTPFASPVGPFKPNNAQVMNRLVGQPFPWVGVGAPRSEQVQPQTPLVGSVPQTYGLGAKKKAPVQVKDEKLGTFFAAIAQSLNKTVSSINQKQANIESDIQSAKQSNIAIAEGLKYSNDTVADKLDAIANILNQQMALAKLQADKAETSEVVAKLDDRDKVASTDRYVDIGENPTAVRKENELEDTLDPIGETEDFGGVDFPNFEQGGIVSGPDSGYLVRLHGDEMITPLDNNYTQGQPSAVDGVTRKQYETGTGVTPPTVRPPAMNFFAQNPSEHAGNIMKSPVDDVETPKLAAENLIDAMKLPFEVASLGIMAATGNAVNATPGFTGMKTSYKGVIAPVAQAFSVKDSISGKVNNLLETKSVQSETKYQELFKSQQQQNRRAWWDIFGLFRKDERKDEREEGEGGDKYGYGGPGLSGAANLQNLYHGTSNARAGSIFSGGFKPSNAMSWAGKGKSFLTPDFWNAAQYARPGATGLNPFSVKGLPNTGFGNMMSNKGKVLNVLQPRGAGLRLPGWLKNLGLSPEVAVKPKQATKGLNLAQRLLGGKYPNSATANMVRQMMTSPATGRGMGMMSKLSPLLQGGMKLGSKALGIASFLTDFIFPEPTAQYDQMHGPNAYYNDPRFTGERPEWAPPQMVGEKSAIVDLESKEQSLNKLGTRTGVDPNIVNMSAVSNEVNSRDEPTSHIDNVGDSQVEEYQFVYSAFK